MKQYRIAFAGFRHPHIFALYQLVQEKENCIIVGTSEEHEETRTRLSQDHGINCTHHSLATLLDEQSPDILAIGDVYGLRGKIAIEALERGIHVISDKPICTSLEELEAIAAVAQKRKLSVGCMLDLRETAPFVTLEKLIRKGAIGQVTTLTFLGQHPLLRRTRASWYFEPGSHGGTINDIGIHAFDMASWLTESPWEKTIASRSWNAKASDVPHFLDCAQMLGQLKDGTGVLADFSYLAPDKLGYTLPQYWRVTAHGTRGCAETYYNAKEVALVKDGSDEIERVSLDSPRKGAYLDDFFADIEGRSTGKSLTTSSVLEASRQALIAQNLSLK